jgi:hypothetical protein
MSSEGSEGGVGAYGMQGSGWRHGVLLGALVLVGTMALLSMVAPQAQAQDQSRKAPETAAELRARLAELEPRLAALSDRRDIRDTSMRYVRGADRHDKDLVRSAFWPEATISYGKPMPVDEFVAWDESRLAAYAVHQHHITGQTVEIDGNTAHVESYVISFFVPRDKQKDGAGNATPGRALISEKSLIGSGRYIERWEKRNGEWKIVVREYVEDLGLQGETIDNCGTRVCLGTWDRNDPSYMRPLQPMTAEERRKRGEAGKKPTSPQGSGK